MRKNYSKAFKTLLLSCVDNSGYSDIELKTDKEKELFLVETFKSEMDLAGNGVLIAATNWLQGLASACSVPYWNDEIIEFMNKIEYTVVKDEGLIVYHYWERMANEVAKLYWKYI